MVPEMHLDLTLYLALILFYTGEYGFKVKVSKKDWKLLLYYNNLIENLKVVIKNFNKNGIIFLYIFVLSIDRKAYLFK